MGQAFRIGVALAIVGAATGCKKPSEPRVSDAWVRLAAAPGRPAAGYFTLHGGATDWTLVTISTSAAKRIELHETMRMGAGSMGAMSMHPIGQVAVPAGGQVAFAPAGRHAMLFDVDPGLKPGGTVRLNFIFANGRNLVADALAVAAGDPPPVK